MIRVDCCGWPVGRRQYATVFDLVEVQQSFYNLPRLATAERWRRQMPPGFEFVLKAPQLITHDPASPTYRKLRVPLTEAQKTRYGSFRPTPEVRAAWAETPALARMLASRLVLSSVRCRSRRPPSTETQRAGVAGGVGGRLFDRNLTKRSWYRKNAGVRRVKLRSVS